MKVVIGLLIVLLWATLPLYSQAAAPVCQAETSDPESPPSDPQTTAWTPSHSGAGTVAIIHVGLRDTDVDNTVVSGVTSSAGGTFSLYGNNVEAGSVDILSYVFYSTDFVAGAQTLSIDYNAAPLQGHVAVFVCTGVKRPNPWLGAATTGQVEATSISLAVPCQVGSLAIDFMNVGSLPAGEAPTMGGGQTELYNVASGTDNMDSAASTEPGAATNTMSWATLGSTEIWGSVGGCLVPPSSNRPLLVYE